MDCKDIIKFYHYNILYKVAAILIFTPVILFCQDTTINKKNMSFSLQCGYLIPQNTSGNSDSKIDTGFEIRPSIHYRFSKKITGLVEFNHSQHIEHSNKKANSVIFRSLNLGMRIFAEPDSDFYIKTAISYFVDDGFPVLLFPQFISGIGNDFSINRSVDLIGEAEIITNILLGFGVSFSLTVGLKYNFL